MIGGVLQAQKRGVKKHEKYPTIDSPDRFY